MLVAVISDIHDNLVNLEKTLAWCKNNQVAKIICTGDVTDIETLIYLSHNFSGEIFLIKGNGELYDEKDLAGLPNVIYSGHTGYATIGGLNIAFCHEPWRIDSLIARAPHALDFIFHGHTHKPWLEKRGALQIACPGNLAGIYYAATFAVLDTRTRELKLKILIEM